MFLYVFVYILDMYAAFPYLTMEAAAGCRHNSWSAVFGFQPTFLKSILAYGQAAHLFKS